MPTDPQPLSAAERLRWQAENAEHHRIWGVPATFLADASEVLAVLAAYDRACQERDALRCKYCSLTGTAHHECWIRDPREYIELQRQLEAAEQRATRLEALAQAAEAWAVVFVDAPAQEPWYSPWVALHAAVAARRRAGEGT